MELVTAWVKPPTQIGGLDHLGVQAPCINIYSRLLPGITNVTDRARYYSFYPWLIWALEQNGYSRYDDEFINAFRKADGLFTLIAHRHANVCGDHQDVHAMSTVGSVNLSKVISAIADGHQVILSDYSNKDSGKQQYFKNKLGGLGQYYLGVLSEFSILDGNVSKGIRYTRQMGLPLVRAMDTGVPRDLFMRTIDEGTVTANRLDELSAFCPCKLTSSRDEHQWLAQLFMAESEIQDTDSQMRRATLCMLIQLSDALSEKKLPLNLVNFRGCVYSGAMPDGSPWRLHDELETMQKLWAVYQRNELLSISIQGLFFVLLDAYQESGEKFDSSQSIAEWYVNQSGELSGKIDFDRSFGDVVSESKETLPSYEYWGDSCHEVELSEQIVLLCSGKKSAENRTNIVKAALGILAALAARQESNNSYKSIGFPNNYLHTYPVNLASFLHESKTNWSEMKLNDLLVWLFSHWGIDTHLSVALRKLRGQSKSTFRIRPSDQGFEVINIPPAVHTSPRFTQAIRILKDIGCLESDGELIRSTPLAQTYMDKYYGR
ncbi:TPA: hypothetical protein ACF311_000479 [Vibrio parahaemolyticus]|uniref:hypothetical protein n=1 Tax=Vibrio parahaemolyticus TaxID=670 RepID=UPI00226AEEA5|nr:hypothetical protein [Vibrio parahaemolyticus]MCX8860207.1 hypothetical protein [Vibrio parahaemolyticus]MCX8870443.1 hypothetical protein [Vibrio parahaemolyticus]MCX8900681.1 hypothetical protein [Vibrio parahaemolyticus]MCX8920991.1 hypothetical protein [Vibrio parahaemolyticus]HCH4058706.1 hypothetical protein [Vibrio parahaemolyticus]